MKGIKKVFLALVFLTLFGVGFTVNVKAAGPTLGIYETSTWTTDGLGVSFSESIDDFKVKDTATADAWVAEISFPIKIVDASSNVIGAGKTIKFRVKKTTTPEVVNPVVEYSIDGGTYASFNGTVPITGLATPTQIKNDLKNKSSFSNTYKAGPSSGTITDITGDANLEKSSFVASISAGNSYSVSKVTCTAQYEGATLSGATFIPGQEYYLLNGEYADFSTAAPAGSHGYKFTNEWTVGGTPVIGANARVTGNGSAISVVAKYEKDLTAFDITDLKDHYVKAGSTVNKNVTYAGGYDANEVGEVKLGTSYDSATVYTPGDVFTGTNFSMQIPSGASGAQNVYVKMKDGVMYTFPINVYSNIGFTLASPITTTANNTARVFYPTVTGPAPDGLTVSQPAASTTYFTAARSGTYNLAVTGKAETPATPSYMVTLTPHYTNVDGDVPGAIEVRVIVGTVVPVELNNVYVNNKQTVTLSDFIKNGADPGEVVTVTNGASSYIDISSTPAALNKIKITGKSKVLEQDKGIRLDTGETAKVTVFSEPTISIETSGSGSSYKQTITVKMPKGVYHDGTEYWVSDLSKATLEFKSSSSDGKTKKITLDSFSEDSSDKTLKVAKKTFDSDTLLTYFREICQNDEETVKVRAYAVNGKGDDDDKIKTEEKEIKVYKIRLDSSGNATYTVNGRSISDYFYGINGVTYTVKASPTNGGTLDKTNSSSEFSAGDTKEFQVAGARTLKAVYKSGGSGGEGSGGSMDDMDEVPQTGESKADIWILWTVLFISILGAGFMIWKRFGLVRAIAEAETEAAIAEEEERIENEKKEKEDKLNMLKDLRNL